MPSKKSIIFALIIMLVNFARAEVISTYSIESSTVKNIVEKVDADTIVLINIEDTLIRPKSTMFIYTNPYHSFLDILIAASKDRPFFNRAIQNWYIQRKLVPVEPTWPEFIETLKNRSPQIWGLNQLNYKIYELIKNPEEWRYNELASLGVHFNDKFNGQSIVRLSSIPNKQPMFYKGIIFTSKANKSEAILDLLKTGSLRPKRIVVFDNNLGELELIQRALRKFDIDFYGINYLAISELKTKVNESLIKFQQDKLIEEGKWLEDEQALEVLGSKDTAK